MQQHTPRRRLDLLIVFVHDFQGRARLDLTHINKIRTHGAGGVKKKFLDGEIPAEGGVVDEVAVDELCVCVCVCVCVFG